MNINMTRIFRQTSYVFFLSLALLFSSYSSATETKTSQNLGRDIENTMDQLILKLKQNKAEYKKDAGLFYHDLNAELSEIIDFKRIALKVMGKYGRKASTAQRSEFISVFKQSLYKSYAAVLLENNDVEVKVINSSVNSRNPKKAQVNMEIKNGSGSSYAVSYSLNKGKDKTFRVENIVIMGINMGLAFRDHFQQQMKVHRGDINAVINNWSSEVVANA